MTEHGIRLTFQSGLCREQVQLCSSETRVLYDQAFNFLERQYPDYVTKYLDLQDNIILLVHCGESVQTETMEMVRDMSSLQSGDVIEVVVSGHAREIHANIRPHFLFVHSYKSPTFCDFCGEMLWGLVRQGVKCDGCGANYHKRCAYRIPNNCSRQRERLRRQSAASTTPNLPRDTEIASFLDSVHVPPSHRTGPGGYYIGRPIEVDFLLREHSRGKVVPHRFVTHTYKTPTVCVYCKKLLVGVVRQGKQCKDCKYNVHARCERYVPMHCERQIENKLRKLSLVTPSKDPLPLENDSDSLTIENPQLIDLDSDSHILEKSVSSGSPASPNDRSGRRTVSAVVHGGDRERHASSSEDELKEENGSELGQETGGDETDNGGSETSSTTEPQLVQLKPNSSTANIPLMRIFQSFRTTRRHVNKIVKEGPMNHFTSLDPNKTSHWWRLDTKNLCLYKDRQSPSAAVVIPLSEILAVEYAPDTPSTKHNWTPHCFTMRTAAMMYYVGESTHQTECTKSTPPSDSQMTGTGGKEEMTPTQVAESWEEAISQARMPVAPRPSGSIKRRSLPESKQLATSVVRQEAVEEVPKKEEEEEEEDIGQRYQIFTDEVLGSGQFGVVYAGVHRRSGDEVAIKVIDKARFPTKQETALKNEVAILEHLVHPGIVTLAEMFETAERVFVVMEKMRNDMLEMILNSKNPKGRLPERVTKFITFQVLCALKFLHSESIVHCDLKPENVLLASDSPMPQVKICDFGFARIIGEKSFRKSVVGTPAYLAPEVLKSRPYNRSLDMWSVGVVMYVSLSGTFPFNEDEEIADQIQNAAFMYPANPWADISREAIDLVGKLLRVDQRRRYNVAKASNHIWFQTREAWDDLRRLEAQVGKRYLTDEKLDQYWLSEQSSNPVSHNPIAEHPHVANGSASPTGHSPTKQDKKESKAKSKGTKDADTKKRRGDLASMRKFKTVSEGMGMREEDRHAEEVERRLSKLGYPVSPI